MLPGRAPSVAFPDKSEPPKSFDGADAQAFAAVGHDQGLYQTLPDDIQALASFPTEGPDATALKLSSAAPGVNAQVSRPIEKQPPLAVSDAKVVRLQERAADTIGSGFAEAARLARLVTDLEERIARISVKGRALGHADALVGHLEQRAALSAAKLEQLARATGKLGDDLARLQNAVRTVTAATRQLAGRNDRARLDDSRSGLKAVGAVILAGLTVLAVVSVMRPSTQLTATPISVAPTPERLVARGSSPILPSRASTSPIATQMPTAPSTTTTDLVQPLVFMGELLIKSSPVGADVFIDQQYVGETPLQLTHVRAGYHLVRIERDGRKRWTAAVVVRADKRVQVRANLRTDR